MGFLVKDISSLCSAFGIQPKTTVESEFRKLGKAAKTKYVIHRAEIVITWAKGSTLYLISIPRVLCCANPQRLNSTEWNVNWITGVF